MARALTSSTKRVWGPVCRRGSTSKGNSPANVSTASQMPAARAPVTRASVQASASAWVLGTLPGGAGWATGPRKEPRVALRAAWAGVREDAEGREDGDGQLWGGHWDLRMGLGNGMPGPFLREGVVGSGPWGWGGVPAAAPWVQPREGAAGAPGGHRAEAGSTGAPGGLLRARALACPLEQSPAVAACWAPWKLGRMDGPGGPRAGRAQAAS